VRREGAGFEGDNVNERRRDWHGDSHELSPAAARSVNAPDQALWVCEAFAETSHPCDRRSQTMHFRNIEPRSHDTQ